MITLEAGTKRIDVQLNPKLAILYGVVMDAYTENTIPGAQITVNEHSTTSNFRGEYRIEGLEYKGYGVTVSKTNYEIATFNVSIVDRLQEFNIILTPITVLYGKVTDIETGEPIVGVGVDYETPLGHVVYQTDINGNYEYALEPGTYIFVFRHSEYETVRQEVKLAGMVERNISMRRIFYPVVTVHGIVRDIETQVSIPDVLVQMNGLSTNTNYEGYYVFLNNPAGNYTITFSHPDYEIVERSLALGAQEVLEQHISMMPIVITKVLLSGRIMNIEGDPIPWSDVFIYPGVEAGNYPAEKWKIRVKADGQGYYQADVSAFGIGAYYITVGAISPPRYEIGQQWATLNYGENVVDFYLKLFQ